ncbi:ribonuclease HIII [Mycoplasmoides fastidiosum]|uniref:Ribonuclease n=1 Tax=Mycoplasmoides fastidiosum TaxID=92758 RepID=A0ABU0M028_9BACT|nr:hypothetical protein [Mycoplasmoides fastidiosum]MDQ0514300.1 ribonuclease HIII [Mycoplasmoides fastidiosum]UUD38096.1 hypothetical protein NPA10_01785 [Mycoplasmoides fastidiosum]
MNNQHFKKFKSLFSSAGNKTIVLNSEADYENLISLFNSHQLIKYYDSKNPNLTKAKKMDNISEWFKIGKMHLIFYLRKKKKRSFSIQNAKEEMGLQKLYQVLSDEILKTYFDVDKNDIKKSVSAVTDKTNNSSSSTSAKKATQTKTESKLITFAGGDESGKGDYFGNLTIAVCYLDDETQKKLTDLENKIQDSKKLSPEKICILAEEIQKILEGRFVIISVPPKLYNQYYLIFENQNVVLTYLYWIAWIRLKEKYVWEHKNSDGFDQAEKIIDGFITDANLLEDYFKKIKNKFPLDPQTGRHYDSVGEFTFAPILDAKDFKLVAKAEDKYLSVACASILARDRFVKSIENACKELNCNIKLGANFTKIYYDLVIEQIMKVKNIKSPEEAKFNYMKFAFKTPTK